MPQVITQLVGWYAVLVYDDTEPVPKFHVTYIMKKEKGCGRVRTHAVWLTFIYQATIHRSTVF